MLERSHGKSTYTNITIRMFVSNKILFRDAFRTLSSKCQTPVFAKTVTLECPLIEGGGEEVVVVLVEGLGGGGAGGLENTSKLCLINTVHTLLNTKTESSRSVLVAVTFKKQHIFESNIFF